MEHPIFSLSTKPDHRVRRYERNDTVIEVEPGARGMATIYDKDILIFAISQIMSAKNSGQPYSRQVRFFAKDLLVYTNRQTNGQAYEALKDSLARLDGTRMRTTVKTGGEENWNAFGLIESATIRKQSSSGRVVEWGVTLSEWLFRAIEANEVLSIHPDYFRLRKPLDRRIYEIMRKHCGSKSEWRISLDVLHQKTGSSSPLKKFRFQMKEICNANLLPDYELSFEDDMITCRRKEGFLEERFIERKERMVQATQLKGETYQKARAILDGWDVYVVEREWRAWVEDKGIEPESADALFISFCKKWRERQGSAY